MSFSKPEPQASWADAVVAIPPKRPLARVQEILQLVEEIEQTPVTDSKPEASEEPIVEISHTHSW